LDCEFQGGSAGGCLGETHLSKMIQKGSKACKRESSFLLFVCSRTIMVVVVVLLLLLVLLLLTVLHIALMLLDSWSCLMVAAPR
jgi:hypothetical protein